MVQWLKEISTTLGSFFCILLPTQSHVWLKFYASFVRKQIHVLVFSWSWWDFETIGAWFFSRKKKNTLMNAPVLLTFSRHDLKKPTTKFHNQIQSKSPTRPKKHLIGIVTDLQGCQAPGHFFGGVVPYGGWTNIPGNAATQPKQPSQKRQNKSIARDSWNLIWKDRRIAISGWAIFWWMML